MPRPKPKAHEHRAPPRASRALTRSSLRALVALAALCSAVSYAAAPQGTPAGQPPRFTPPAVSTLPSLPSLEQGEAWQTSQAAIGRVLADHALLDRQGRPVRLSSYRGKPLLVSFIYTGCFKICPTSTRSLRDSLQPLYDAFGAENFNVISVGFNQPADSPSAMRAFSAQHGIDAPNWDFLSPPPASVDALTRDFGFSYKATPIGFDHVLGVSVVDAEGRLHAQVYGEALRADLLGEPLKQLLRGGPMPQREGLDALIERVRIICTVYDPDTGTYRTNYGLILEIAGGVTFALAMTVFFALEARSRRRARRGPLPESAPLGPQSG
ncbi:MAG: SCO family protein [Rubrivivax sp.]